MTQFFRDRDLQTARRLPDEQHPVVLYLAHLGPGSRRTMTEATDKLARLASDGRCDSHTLPWHALRQSDTAALRERLASSLAPATANKHLAALRGVLKQAWRLGLMSAEDYQRAIDLPPVHGVSPRPARTLGADEMRALLATCERDPSPSGARDAALLSLLFGAALRRSEVVAIELADYDRSDGTVRLQSLGRGTGERLQAGPEALRALDAWIDRRGTEPGPLFNPINKGGRIEVRRLSEQAIYVACRKRAAEAGLPPVSPEDLRRAPSDPVPQRRMRRVRRMPSSGAIHQA